MKKENKNTTRGLEIVKDRLKSLILSYCDEKRNDDLSDEKWFDWFKNKHSDCKKIFIHLDKAINELNNK